MRETEEGKSEGKGRHGGNDDDDTADNNHEYVLNTLGRFVSSQMVTTIGSPRWQRARMKCCMSFLWPTCLSPRNAHAHRGSGEAIGCQPQTTATRPVGFTVAPRVWAGSDLPPLFRSTLKLSLKLQSGNLFSVNAMPFYANT